MIRALFTKKKGEVPGCGIGRPLSSPLFAITGKGKEERGGEGMAARPLVDLAGERKRGTGGPLHLVGDRWRPMGRKEKKKKKEEDPGRAFRALVLREETKKGGLQTS